MKFDVEPCPFSSIAALRSAFRAEATCQIVRDSILGRGMADSFAICAGGRLVGYAGVWNVHYPGRLMEFHLSAEVRAGADQALRRVIEVSQATEFEAQTNLRTMHELLEANATSIATEKLLFGEPQTTDLACPLGVFEETGPYEWSLFVAGQAVAHGGLLRHYNPPYVDVFMEVDGNFRQQGLGSYLVQELKKRAWDLGLAPAARSDPENRPSHQTLKKAGFREVGQLRVGRIQR